MTVVLFHLFNFYLSVICSLCTFLSGPCCRNKMLIIIPHKQKLPNFFKLKQTWSENIKIESSFTKISSAFGGLSPQTHYRGFAPKTHWGLPSPRPLICTPLLSNPGYDTAEQQWTSQKYEQHTKVLNTIGLGWSKVTASHLLYSTLIRNYKQIVHQLHIFQCQT